MTWMKDGGSWWLMLIVLGHRMWDAQVHWKSKLELVKVRWAKMAYPTKLNLTNLLYCCYLVLYERCSIAWRATSTFFVAMLQLLVQGSLAWHWPQLESASPSAAVHWSEFLHVLSCLKESNLTFNLHSCDMLWYCRCLTDVRSNSY